MCSRTPRTAGRCVTGCASAGHSAILPAFAPYRPTGVRPSRKLASDAELKAYLREATATVHHPVGSCRMGIDALAVVDPNLKVCGVDSLRGVDASVFPGIVGGNTNAPIVMVAEKAAALITGRNVRGKHGG